ncbi:hypothetical protein Tco_1475488 [Tanacetum coccineum]
MEKKSSFDRPELVQGNDCLKCVDKGIEAQSSERSSKRAMLIIDRKPLEYRSGDGSSDVEVSLESYACSDSLLLTPLCCDDIHDVTPRVSALAGCDRLVSEPLVIEKLLRRVKSRIRLCTHAKRQGRECDSINTAWPGPTNVKEGRWRYLVQSGADKMYYDLRDMYSGHVWRRIFLPISWWKIYFMALVDIVEGIENTAKTCVRLIILKRMDKEFDVFHLKRCMEGSVGHMFFWAEIGEIQSNGSELKYLAGYKSACALEEIKVDKTLRFVEEPVEIIDREVESLKRIKSRDEISLRRGYCDNCALSRDLEAAFEYPGEFHSPIFTMFSWDGNDVKIQLIEFLVSDYLISWSKTDGFTTGLHKDGDADASFQELVDQAWEKHSHDHFRAPTAHDMEILIKTCLMPLSIKTQNDSFIFVHELKQEMHADLKYVESLEKEFDELESDKAEFSNMYDMLLQECVSNDVMCSYLHLLSDLDAHNELQCLYLHKVKE